MSRRSSPAVKGRPPVNAWLRQSLGIDLSWQALTRFVSWLESVSTGTHPRTKGARSFTGGHRPRILALGRVSSRSGVQGVRALFKGTGKLGVGAALKQNGPRTGGLRTLCVYDYPCRVIVTATCLDNQGDAGRICTHFPRLSVLGWLATDDRQ